MTVIRTWLDGAVMHVVLDRPPVNAWDWAQLESFENLTEKLRSDSEVGLVVITGSGGHFCAGADIALLDRSMRETSGGGITDFTVRIQAAFTAWAELPMPTVAAIRGAATGGGLELALASDLRVCSPTVRLGLSEVRLGLLPAGGGTQRLVAAVGYSRAMQLMLTGEMLDGEQAQAVGLVNWCIPDDGFEGQLAHILKRLTEHAGPAQREIKRCAQRAGDTLGFASEIAGQSLLQRTEEALTRTRQFIDGRRVG